MKFFWIEKAEKGHIRVWRRKAKAARKTPAVRASPKRVQGYTWVRVT